LACHLQIDADADPVQIQLITLMRYPDFYLMWIRTRMRNQDTKMMWIHVDLDPDADPDPQRCHINLSSKNPDNGRLTYIMFV
jgi:hypothetical protein